MCEISALLHVCDQCQVKGSLCSINGSAVMSQSKLVYPFFLQIPVIKKQLTQKHSTQDMPFETPILSFFSS